MKEKIDEAAIDRQARLIKILESKPQKFWIRELRIQHNILRAWRMETFPRTEYLMKICELAEVNVNWLLWGIGPMLLKDINNKYREEVIEKETEFLNLQLDQKENEMELQAIKYENRIRDLELKIDNLEKTLKIRNSVKCLYDLFDKELAESSLANFPDAVDTLLSPVIDFLGVHSKDLLIHFLDYLKSDEGRKAAVASVEWVKERR